MSNTGYGNFALFYDILTANIDYKKIAAYYDGLIQKFGGTKGILLDLGCGTGSLSVKMATLGYDIIGVDSSPEMLSVAAGKQSEITYVCQDMSLLDLYGTIDVTISATDSLNHLPCLARLYDTFEKVSLFTNPGGLFLFDVNTVYKCKNILGNNTFVYDLDDVFCVWQNNLSKYNKTLISLDIFEKRNEQKNTYKRYSENFAEIAFSDAEIKTGLKNAGFELLAVYDYLTLTDVSDTAEKAVYAARKI